MKLQPKTNQLMIIVLGLICLAIILGMMFGKVNHTGGMTVIGTIAGNLGATLKEANIKETKDEAEDGKNQITK